MKVAIINQYKEKYKDYLTKVDSPNHNFYFEIIQNWKENWNIEGNNLAQIYEASLKSQQSARLWGGSNHSPKSLMITLIKEEEEFLRSTFRDLFKESLDLGLRLDRFGFHADQVFKSIQSKHPKYVSHFHHEREIKCLYLALEYPDKYCLFNYPVFNTMMGKFESRKIPSNVEVERYYKSCRGIFNLLSKDEVLMALIKEKYDLQNYEPGLMVMSVFMEFVAIE